MKRLLKSVMRSLGPRLAQSRACRDLFYFAARDFTSALGTTTGRYHYFVNPADRTVGREVYLNGGFDDGCIEQTFAWLAQMGFANFRGKCFLDIGANIGTTTVPVVSERGFTSGVAIEPEPGNFRLLQANVAANGLENRIRCVHLALSDKPGTAEMELCPVNLGDHRLRSKTSPHEDGIYHEASRETVTVQTAVFDTLVTDGTIPLAKVGVVWMDTQGFEGHILQGAKSLLLSNIPFVTEFWPYALERSGGLERFLKITAEHYRAFVDLRTDPVHAKTARQPISCLPKLVEQYQGPALTDLLFLK